MDAIYTGDLLGRSPNGEGLGGGDGGKVPLTPGAVPASTPSSKSSSPSGREVKPSSYSPSSSSSLPATLGVNGSTALLSLRVLLPVMARTLGGGPPTASPPAAAATAARAGVSAAGTSVVVKVGEGEEAEGGKATPPALLLPPFGPRGVVGLVCMAILLALALGLGLGYGLKPTLGGGTTLGSPTPSPAPSASSKMANFTKRVNVVSVWGGERR
jgi:hypothetical protein